VSDNIQHELRIDCLLSAVMNSVVFMSLRV